jgi:DNA polymerase III sliding clamp (beta) subunit (PCNA family)
MKIKTLKSIKTILIRSGNTLPILDCFLINKEFLYASDLEIYIKVRHHFPIKEGSLQMAVRADHFLSRVEHIRAPYTINCDGVKIAFVHGAQTTIMNTDDPNDYPTGYIESTKDDLPTEYCTITAKEIGFMNTALGFTADDELRPVMQAVCLSKDYIVASDAHKLYYKKITELTKEDVLFDRRVIRLMKLFPGQSYKISKGGRNYCAASDDVTIWWRIDSLNYPGWKSVVTPKEHSVIIPVKELIEAMDAIYFAVNQAAGRVKFNIKGDSMVLAGSDLDYMLEASESVPIINTEAAEIEFGFKFTFLRQILKALQDEGYSQVSMAFTDNTKSFTFEDQMLLMPMMINY